MAKYRSALPQLGGDLFITDGGLETTLIFQHGFELPEFAAFALLADAQGKADLEQYFRLYADIARRNRVGIVLDTPTWRASADWGGKIGYSVPQLKQINRQAISMLSKLREEYETQNNPVVISGCIGPRDDGYQPLAIMTADDAEVYHSTQINTFSDTWADMLSALTMTYVDEAIGIVRAAQSAQLPITISFTV